MISSRLRLVGLLGVAIALFAACGGNDDPTAGTNDGADAGGSDAVTLQLATVDNSFEPSSLSAPAGAEVTVEVTNNGSNPHTFNIDELDVETGTIAAGDTATATFTMPDSSVMFYCAIHGETAMSGTIEAS